MNCYSRRFEDHVRQLRVVLELLRDHQFVVNWKKCAFSQTEINYLRHIVSAEGVVVDPHKVQAMLE